MHVVRLGGRVVIPENTAGGQGVSQKGKEGSHRRIHCHCRIRHCCVYCALAHRAALGHRLLPLRSEEIGIFVLMKTIHHLLRVASRVITPAPTPLPCAQTERVSAAGDNAPSARPCGGAQVFAQVLLRAALRQHPCLACTTYPLIRAALAQGQHSSSIKGQRANTSGSVTSLSSARIQFKCGRMGSNKRQVGHPGCEIRGGSRWQGCGWALSMLHPGHLLPLH